MFIRMELNKPCALNLNGDSNQNFSIFKKDVITYFLATEVNKEPENYQIVKLKYLLGPEALQLYNTLKTNKVEQETVGSILDVLETYCRSRKNETIQVFTFLTRIQQVEEPFDTYYTQLNNLVKTCNFGDQEEKLLRAQLIIGLQNKSFQDKILTEDMSLDRIIIQSKSMELAEVNRSVLENDSCDEITQPLQVKPLEIHENQLTNQDYCPNCTYCDIKCSIKSKKCNYCLEPNRYMKVGKDDSDSKCVSREIKEEKDGSQLKDVQTQLQSESTEQFETVQNDSYGSFELVEVKQEYDQESYESPSEQINTIGHGQIHENVKNPPENIVEKTVPVLNEQPTAAPCVINPFSRFITILPFNQPVPHEIRVPILPAHYQSFPDKKIFECETCQKQFPFRSRLLKHMRLHTSLRPYQCEICKKTFKEVSNLEMHKQIHTVVTEQIQYVNTCTVDVNNTLQTMVKVPVDPAIITGKSKLNTQCGVCDKKFNAPSRLARHIRVHTGVTPFKCELCHKWFKELSNLKEHLRVHDKNAPRPHECDTCHKTFYNRSHLVNHLRTHTGERPYECELCSKRFNSRGNLARHVQYHNGEKNYACDLCAKRFVRRSNLDKHVQVHTREKTFICKVCGKAFLTNINLTFHMRSHASERHYTCELCAKKFNDQIQLKTHLKTHAKQTA